MPQVVWLALVLDEISMHPSTSRGTPTALQSVGSGFDAINEPHTRDVSV
jgi:hypothetical protein